MQSFLVPRIHLSTFTLSKDSPYTTWNKYGSINNFRKIKIYVNVSVNVKYASKDRFKPIHDLMDTKRVKIYSISA